MLTKFIKLIFCISIVFYGLTICRTCVSAQSFNVPLGTLAFSPLGTHRVPATLPMTESLVNLKTEVDFEGLLREAPGRVLVDFYADWCGPCQVQSQILQDVAKEIDTREAFILKVDIDKHPDLAERFQVSSLPSLIVFENGEVVSRQIGVADKHQVSALLEK